MEQLRYIFEVYAQENISLKRLLNLLVSENKNPLDGSHWTTAKLSTILRNPIYVKADADIYDYYESNGVQMISGVEQFTGEFGAQLYGQNKHKADAPDCSDMKLVLLSHAGIVDSTIWLRCQRKLEKNRQIGKSCSNQTSWLAGKVICEKCGHGMTIIKGKPDKNGNFRRYFNCTGRSHKKSCSGPKCTIYAEDLEQMVYDCIRGKLAVLMNEKNKKPLLVACDVYRPAAIEQLKEEKLYLHERLDEIRSTKKDIGSLIDLAHSWKRANYERKKAVAMILIHQILISEDGSTKVIWNI